MGDVRGFSMLDLRGRDSVRYFALPLPSCIECRAALALPLALETPASDRNSCLVDRFLTSHNVRGSDLLKGG